MARVLSPTGIPLVQAAAVEQPRAKGEAFGAQIGAAQQEAGRSMQSLGLAIGHFQEQRQAAEDQAYLDRADLELDMKYGQIARDEQIKAVSGAENMTDTVRKRMDEETSQILGGVQESAGLRPSAEAIKKAQHIAAKRQHQHLTHATVYEHNERIRHLGGQLDGTLAMIAANGAQTGNLDDAITRAEQSVDAYKGVIPPAGLDKMRQRAAQHFVEQMSANTDPEVMQSLMQRMTRGEPRARASSVVSLPPEAAAAVDDAARAAGVDSGLLRAIVKVESGGDPAAAVKSGKYSGLFQLSDEEFRKYGSGDRTNARDNAAAGAAKIRAEIEDFKQQYGKEPTPGDIYLRHQQGKSGYEALTANADLPAWEALTKGTSEWRNNPEGAKKAISGNLPAGMRGRAEQMTAGEFKAFWAAKVGEQGAMSTQAAPRGAEQPDGSFSADGLNIQNRFERTAPYGQRATAAAVPFKGIVVHSTGNDTSSAQDQVAYGQHRDTARGGAFGYHFYIDKDGAVIQGAPMDKRTNHIMPQNSPERASTGVALDNASSVGISFIGSEGHETPAQIESFRKLSASLGQTYGFDPHASTFGHGEIQGNKQHQEGARAVAALRAGPDMEYAPNPVMAEQSIRGALAREMADKGPKLQAAIEKKREAMLHQQHAQRLMDGELPVDPARKEDRAVIDKAVGSTDIVERLGKADEAAAAQLTAIVKSSSYMPEDAMSRLRAMSANGNAQEQTFAYETAANILRQKPGALEGSPKGKGLREDAESYDALVRDAGVPPAEALKRIAESRTPEFEKRRESFKKAAGDKAKLLTAADLESEFSHWWQLRNPTAGGSPRETETLLRTFRELYADHYARNGDDTIARSAALGDIKRTYGVSSVTGSKRLMHHPVEERYPALPSKPGATPDHSYFTRQLQEAVDKEAGRPVPMSDIFLETIPQTQADIRAGRAPAYGVVYRQDDGSGPRIHVIPGAFYADTKMEIEHARAQQGQAAMEARRQNIRIQDSGGSPSAAGYLGKIAGEGIRKGLDSLNRRRDGKPIIEVK